MLERLEARINWERKDRSKGWRVDLAPIEDLVARAGFPSRGYGLCHIAGSKGKGSVANLIAAGLARAGQRVGVFGSPHVEEINERIRIDGQSISGEALGVALTAALQLVADAEEAGSVGAEASWFDIVTLAGLLAFREARVDWAVLEVGLGGRLDSTNVIEAPDLSVVTSIALEHTAILGDTLAAIAREKGGIVKAGTMLVTGTPPDGEAHGVLAEIAAVHAVEHVVAWSDADRTFEEANARVARVALDHLGRRVEGLSGELLTPEVMAGARLPGRMEWFEPDGIAVLLDGAHVASSMELALDEALSKRAEPWCAVVAIHAEKNAAELVAPMARRGLRRVFATTVPGSGVHHPAAAVAEAAAAEGLEVEAYDRPQEALEAALGWALGWARSGSPDPAQGPAHGQAAGPGEGLARGGPGCVMVTGSLYLVGALRARIEAVRGSR